MKTSTNGIQVLHYFESCKLKAYPDPGTGGEPFTIGWGDTGPDVVHGLVITQDEADARFANRMRNEFEPNVLARISVPMNQGQFDGMVCLIYNIGVTAFNNSTLRKKFNAGDVAGAADQFAAWNRSGGRVMLGLRRRRASEKALFIGMSGEQAIAVGKAVT